ncbi:site-specific integrase [Vagococcus zengguangii]|uniref:Site-specific integrase n=1 Tax=Vagococcus zengguangii TaxID=2571750 RepID=A0A4D7D036_9ENTE|nr:tyrosine-type recombinase/integrase [Vagococcus zengguangii]QCI87116.1 site-specific integrase [Vagococcus zengguangii]
MGVKKEKQKNTWKVDISDGKDPITGKRRRIIKRGIKTRKEAIELEAILRGKNFNDYSPNRQITMNELQVMLQEEDRLRNTKQSYMNTQADNYNKHFKEYFKKAQLHKLTYKDVETFRNNLLEKNLSNNTVNKLIIHLKKLLDIAVKHGVLSENPCTHIKKLKVEQKKMDYWTIEEFKEFLSYFEPNERAYQLYFKLSFLTGMRQGEQLALTWNDIDFSRGTISINKTQVSLKGGNIAINEPKTKASNREITINGSLLTELNEWKKEQATLLAEFITDTRNLQVFQFLPQRLDKNILRRKYLSVLDRTPDTLKRIRMHDFRHSHASLLINQGEDPYLIKERLGHASITTTLDTYGHLYPNKQKSISDKLDSLL